MVGRYAVHCSGVAFSCKKHGEAATGISTPSNANTIDRIRQIHGSAVANELIQLEISDSKWGFKASGWTSNANYHVKKTTVLLFINHRSVESSTIKKAIEQTYATFLPKGGHPFIYISLNIDPQRVDVNVHPTKREVNFLNEDEIIEAITSHIRIKLSEVDTSRTFMTQSLLPSTRSLPLTNPPSIPNASVKPLSSTPTSLVRTDSKVRKITSMLPPFITPNTQLPSETEKYTISPRDHTHCRLTTVKELRASVRDNMHTNLTEVFASHTYVGLVDSQRRIAAMQGGVKLYLVDYGMVSSEYFYQVGLTDFGNFGSIKFDPPLSIRKLVSLAVEIEKTNVNAEECTSETDWDAIPGSVCERLVSRREMLLEYFSLSISEAGDLLSIPLLMKGYTPSLAKLPRFLMRLGPGVDWNDEKECFHAFLIELASFYAVEQLPNEISTAQTGDEIPSGTLLQGNGQGRKQDRDDSIELRNRKNEVARCLEHVLFPAFRARLIATRGLLKGVVEVADLKGLYRVFERC